MQGNSEIRLNPLRIRRVICYTTQRKSRSCFMNTIDSKEVISTLNDLIETSKDGEAGFRTCAEDIKRPELKSLFTERAAQCAQAAQELQAIVIRLGGDPE